MLFSPVQSNHMESLSKLDAHSSVLPFCCLSADKIIPKFDSFFPKLVNMDYGGTWNVIPESILSNFGTILSRTE